MAADAKERNHDTSGKLAIIIQQGKVLDFIDGKTQRPETPEEYVRHEIAKSPVREYRYEKADIEVEFVVRVGSRKPRADLVIFPRVADHAQEKALIIVECKASTVKAADKKDGVGQLQSYMAACPNVRMSSTACGRTAWSVSAIAAW
jgi:type I restriction enzyme M protein